MLCWSRSSLWCCDWLYCSSCCTAVLSGVWACFTDDQLLLIVWLCWPQYLLVYRSPMAEKLFWGLDDADNTMLKLATVKANLTEFPAGCAFEVGCASLIADCAVDT